jgi:hypothetical protein
MFGKSSKTQTRREGPMLRLVVADVVRLPEVRSPASHRGRLRLVPGHWDWDPGDDPSERHSARLALAA